MLYLYNQRDLWQLIVNKDDFTIVQSSYLFNLGKIFHTLFAIKIHVHNLYIVGVLFISILYK